MRIRVAFTTTYSYARPAGRLVQLLKLTPRSYEGQHVTQWRVDVTPDGKLWRHEDPFGNIAHTYYVAQPGSEVSVTVSGEVETSDTAGVVRGAVERVPEPVYLRSTSLTEPDADIVEFAHDSVAGAGEDPIARLHALMGAIQAEMTFDPEPTHVSTTASQSFAIRRGVCQDLAHIFLASARTLGVPARYVSGHLAHSDGRELEASHAWVEAMTPGLGWVGFDPTNGICPTESYLRVAVALDYLGAAPIRGSRYGGDAEALDVRLKADDSAGLKQTQA